MSAQELTLNISVAKVEDAVVTDAEATADGIVAVEGSVGRAGASLVIFMGM